MKKILVMTMAMLAMAFAFTSCGSDDDDTPGGGSAKEVRKVFIFDNGNQYLNRQYKLTVGTETKILKLNELQKETAAPASAKKQVDEEVGGKETINVYSYDIPATMHGDATLKPDFSVKAGVELPEKVDILIAGYIGVGDEHKVDARGNAFYMGLMKEKVQSYLEGMNAKNVASHTLK